VTWNPERHETVMNGAKGFTLTELVIALAVIAILMGIGAPSMQVAAKNAKMVAVTNELVGALQIARSESVKQSLNVSVCARGTNVSCGDNWRNGWLVFQDAGATRGKLDDGETILAVNQEIDPSIDVVNSAITAGASGSANSRSYIRFSPRGGSNWRGGGSFIICDGRGDEAARALNIVMSGDVRNAREDENGKKYDAFGQSVVCPKE